MAYTITNPANMGFMPIANTDAGTTYANASAAAPTTPMKLGMIVRASDPTYGEGEFILLRGVASTTVGSVVTYNLTTYQTSLAPVGSNKPQPIAIAMAATTAALWGWYQISGLAIVAKSCATSFAAGATLGVLTAGFVAASGTGKEVQGALIGAVASATAGRTTVQVVMDRPHMQGRVT